MTFAWDYFTLNAKGQLVRDGERKPAYWNIFASVAEAEEWLRVNDIRGNVR